jgi:rubredoxin
MPFDFIVAALRCPGCGEAVDVEIQTHLQGGVANGSALGIGTESDGVFLEPDHIRGAGYTLVPPTRSGELVRLLDMWSCPVCETEQWALVEIAGGRIERVEGVTLDRATLGSAHYVSDVNADILADSLRGDGDGGATSVEVLLRRLP